MKKKVLLLFSVVVMLAAFSTSCTKECGCMDEDATNYSSTAEEDDGTCLYEGSVVFYYGQSTGSDVYWSGSESPNCDTEGAITTTMDLGYDKFETYTYKVVDDTNFERWSGDITFEANTCIAQELTF